MIQYKPNRIQKDNLQWFFLFVAVVLASIIACSIRNLIVNDLQHFIDPFFKMIWEFEIVLSLKIYIVFDYYYSCY